MTQDEARAARIDWFNTAGADVVWSAATACNTTPAYIRQLAHGYGGRRPSVDMAKLLAEHTGLPREAWRPDVWG